MSAYVRDLLERVVATFVVGALSVLGSNALDLTNVSTLKSAAIGGGAAVLTLVKGLLAKRVGSPDTAGL